MNNPLDAMRVTSTADWGPVTWAALHIYAAKKYPENPTEEQRQKTTTLMQVWVPELIPCGICAYHFNKHAQEIYPHTESNLALSKWLIGIHNEVNRRTGRPVLTLEEAMGHYSRLPEASNAFKSILEDQPVSEATQMTLKRQIYDSTPLTAALTTIVVLGFLVVGLGTYAIILRRSRGKAAREAMEGMEAGSFSLSQGRRSRGRLPGMTTRV